jgi:cytochrome c biogenesis protein CcmG, thiol:disulfide interchange protein DsbE
MHHTGKLTHKAPLIWTPTGQKQTLFSIPFKGPGGRVVPLRRISHQRQMARYVWVLLPVLLLCSCFSKEGLELGDKAPNFELKTLDGKPFRFASPFKKPQVIYFWAVWCRYCEDDLQLLNKLYPKWEKGIDSPRLVAINAGQPEGRIRKYIKKIKPSFPIYLDPDIKVAHRFGVAGLPTYFITDKQGIIRHVILGWADEKALLGEIDKVDRKELTGIP